MNEWTKTGSGDICDFAPFEIAFFFIVVLISGVFGFEQTQAATVMPGATPGFFQVGATGAAEYSAPIRVPPGTGGLRPALSLYYNSRKGNGLAGMGWSLKGLGTITRCSRDAIREKTKAKDTKYAVLSGEAGYCFDGRILVRLNKDRDASETEYRTEIDKGEQIRSRGICDYGPCYFTIRDRKGNRRDFGRSKDSRLKSPNSGKTRAWMLSRVTDRNGNHLRILYDKDQPGSRLYPVEVRYTGNKAAGLRPRRSILFFYENRGDTTNFREEGARITRRLSKVLTKVDENIVKEYRLAYENSPTTLRSRLSSIKECDGVGNCLSPTVFTWENGWLELNPSKTVKETPPEEDITSLPRIMTDINGDGAPDYVYVRPNSEEYWVIFNDGNSFDTSKSRKLSRNIDAIKSISNGVGGLITIRYQQVDALMSFQEQRPASLRLPLHVVSQHGLSDERGNFYIFERLYDGLKIDRRRGIVSFDKISVINRAADRETIRVYHREFPVLGELKRKIERTLNKVALRQSAYFYDMRKTERDVWQVRQTAVTESERSNQDSPVRVRRVEYQYDGRGRQVLKFDSRKPASVNEEIYNCLVYEDHTGDDWWKSWFVIEEKATRRGKTCQGSGFISWKPGVDISQKRFAYDSKMNLVSQKFRDSGKNKWIETHFSYDEYGNLVRKIDPWGTILAITYDAEYHAFPIAKRTNQFTSSLRYDPRFGVKLKETDFNGNTVKSISPVKIDGFGRALETRVSSPEDRSEIVIRKTAFSSSENNKGLKVTVRSRSDWKDKNPESWIWKTKYLDALGRLYKVENQTRDGAVIVKIKELDPQGCALKEAPPYYRPESRPFWDKLQNRPSIIRKKARCRGSGRESWALGREFNGPSAEFPDLSELVQSAVSSNLLPSTRSDLEVKQDAQTTPERRVEFSNNLLALIDRARKRELSDVELKHNSLGQITSIFKDGSKILFLTYTDGGRIETATDAKGQVVSFVYDSLGRVIQKQFFAAGDYPGNPRKIITYTYDEGSDALGRPTSVSAPEATVSFAYDRLGRIKSETTAIYDPDVGEREFVVKYRRDPLGRLTETTYPDNATVKRAYGPDGKIQKIQLKDGDEGIFDGRYSSDGILTFARAYDSSGRLASVRATAAGKKLWDLEYFRDKTGRTAAVVENSRGASSLLEGVVVVAAISASGLGHLMFSRQNVRRRFFIYPPHPENADHFIATTYRDGKWLYNNGHSWLVFTPRKDDVLIAEVDFDKRRFVDLKGENGNFGGVAYGYIDGDLAFAGNLWRDESDKMKLYLNGKIVLRSIDAGNAEVSQLRWEKRRGVLELRDVNGAVTAKGDFRYSRNIEGQLVKVEKKVGLGFKTVYKFTYGPLGARLCKTQNDGSKTFYPSSLYAIETSPLEGARGVKYIGGSIAVVKRESGETQIRYFRRCSSDAPVVVYDDKGRRINFGSQARWFGAGENNLPSGIGPVCDSRSGLYYCKGRYLEYESGEFLSFQFLSSPISSGAMTTIGSFEENSKD